MPRDHVAIMNKSWGLTEKIRSGEKQIESRWYKHRYRPWNEVESGDTIYFKDTGEPVKLAASVSRVIQFEDLAPQKVTQILAEYGKADGISDDQLGHYINLFSSKRYCILIFLSNVRDVHPFFINKAGFGSMAAWITVSHIQSIAIKA
ncbi:hypothetical protein HGA91_05070 [candidate division WWE3 bacterium]|nr:hypothetical protein [candidate division WWE3 bacterium]